MVVRALAAPAERGEVVQPDQPGRGRRHRRLVQRARPGQHLAPPQRVHAGRRVADPVLVAPPQCGEPGVERRAAPRRSAHPDVGRQHAGQPARQLGPAVPGRSPCATWPVACTPASVRPATVSATAGSRSTGPAPSSSVVLHGAPPGLAGPAGEVRPVVGNVEADPHQRARLDRIVVQGYFSSSRRRLLAPASWPPASGSSPSMTSARRRPPPRRRRRPARSRPGPLRCRRPREPPRRPLPRCR